MDGKAGVINRKGDKKLDPRFDPKTLGKTKDLKKPADVNVVKVDHVYKEKYPCKKVPLDQLISIDFQNLKLEDFTKIVACMTGKRFMLAQGVTGQITIMSTEPVTMYEGYKAFVSALEANNLTIVKRGTFYRIIPKTKARSGGAGIYGPGGRIPDTDEMVTQLVPIRHILAEEAKELIQNFATDGADITVYNPTNTLIITEVSTNIGRLRKLIREVDKATGTVKIWIRPVEFADVGDIQKQVEAIFGKGKGGGGRSTPTRRPIRPTPRMNRRPGQPPMNPATPPTGGTLGGRTGELEVHADERTNQLIIVTDRATYLRVDKLIRRLDVPIPGEGQIHIHYLENADAKDVQSTLQALTGGGSGASRGRTGSRRTTNPRTGARGGRTPATNARTNQPGGASLLSGDVKITAHEPTNSLVIEASLKDYVVLLRVIRKLDIRRKQVYLESVIMEITSDKDRQVGLEGMGGLTFDVGGNQVPLLMGNGIPSVTGLQDVLPGGFGALLLGPALGATGGTSVPAFGMALKVLQSNSDVNILQTPHILTTDNEEALIEVGRRVPFNAGLGGLAGLGALGLGGLGGTAGGANIPGLGSLANLGSTLGAFSGLGTIQYADIKISLKIKPTVNESNYIRLEIDQQIDDFDGLDPNTKAPNTSNRHVKNIVVVKDQQAVVIGGLMNDREVETVRKIPVLGDIPLLGVFFRQTTTQVQRKNLLMIIIPHIIDDPSDLRRIHQQRLDEIRRFAEFMATRKKEYMGQINFDKKHGLLQEMHKVIEKARKERMRLEKQTFDDSELDPVGPPDTHDLDYDPYKLEKRRDGSRKAPRRKAPRAHGGD